jgi:hypothetical protein
MKTRRWFSFVLTGLFAGVVCPPLQAQQPTARAQPLFEHVKTTLPANAPALRYAQAYQPVRIRWQHLTALQPGSRLLLNLMEGINPIGVVERIERRAETRYSCFGRLEGVDGCLFILVREEDALALFVSAPPRQMTFDLRYVKDDLYVVVLVGEEPPCGNQGNETPPPFEMAPDDADWRNHLAGQDFEPAGDFGPAACTQPQAVLDIAVYYTTQARTAIGGVSPMNARIQLFIDQCNQAYQNSQVSLTARLVRRLEVTYTGEGGGDSSTQLNALTNPSDGVMDGIHPDRTNYRADQVILLVDNMSGACGRAWCGNGSDPDRAFGVVQWGCTTFTFPHEIGHNQGCGHNRAAGGCGFREYGYGYRFTGSDGQRYRTIMSYSCSNDSCNASDCTGPDAAGIARIPYFSNPSVTYLGAATGRVEGDSCAADNARVIRETSRSRETFRLLDIWVAFGYGGTELGTFTQPFNTVIEGVNAITTFIDTAVLDFPTLYIKAGARNETITITKRMRLQACGGTVRIGAP